MNFKDRNNTPIIRARFAPALRLCVFAVKISCLLLLSSAFLCIAYAQDTKKETDLPAPKNLKILEEYKDAKGNTIRTIQYLQGSMRVSETVIIPPGTPYVHVPIKVDTMKKDSVSLLVDKSHYRVCVYYGHRLIRTYKAVFGPRPLDNKCYEGDRCTPEGAFRISSKNPSSKYNKFLLLSYPDDSSIVRFNRLKEAGHIPANARMGGSIGIHGIWKNGDDMIEMGVGWTDGCVALKNKDIEELYTMVTVGTKVVIKR